MFFLFAREYRCRSCHRTHQKRCSHHGGSCISRSGRFHVGRILCGGGIRSLRSQLFRYGIRLCYLLRCFGIGVIFAADFAVPIFDIAFAVLGRRPRVDVYELAMSVGVGFAVAFTADIAHRLFGAGRPSARVTVHLDHVSAFKKLIASGAVNVSGVSVFGAGHRDGIADNRSAVVVCFVKLAVSVAANFADRLGMACRCAADVVGDHLITEVTDVVFIRIFVIGDYLFAVVANVVFVCVIVVRDNFFAIVADVIFICVLMIGDRLIAVVADMVIVRVFVIILVSEGENNHPFDSKTGILKRQNDRGANIGAFHYALMFNGDSDNAALDSLIGGHYQKGFSYNPFYEAFFDVKNTHPILNGVKPFGYYDEWHFNIKFANDKSQKLTPLIKTKVPDKIRKRRSAPKEVQAELGKNRLETVAWVVENGNGTRGFGIMGGHVPWTLAQKDYRKLVLNMVAWLAETEIPANGFDATMPPFDALAAKIKKQKRGDYQYYIKDWKDADAKWRREK